MTCLSLALCAFLATGPAADEPPIEQFNSSTEGILGIMCMSFGEGVLPLGPEYWAYCKGCREYKDYHSDVRKALRSDDPEMRKFALIYLSFYAFQVKFSRWFWERDEGEGAFGLVLDRHAGPIEASLKRIVKRAKGEEGLLAAATLLTLCPAHQKAINVLVGEMKSNNANQREKACEQAGLVRLSQPQVIAALAAALADKERKVRHAAAQTLGRIGPRAGKAVPGLVALLQRGGDAWGDVKPLPIGLASPFRANRANLALLALAEMGEDGRAAVPLIAQMLNELADMKHLVTPGLSSASPIIKQWLHGPAGRQQLALLACLGSLGPVAKEAGLAIRRCASDNDSQVRIRAAVVMLCLDPADKKAATAVAAALMSSETGGLALGECETLAPKAKALVPILVAVMKSDGGARSVVPLFGKMGEAAESAVPALKRLLEQDKEHEKLESSLDVANALAGAGKAGVAVLLGNLRQERRADGDRKTDEANSSPLLRAFAQPDAVRRMAAAQALGRARNNKAEVVPALLEALKDEVIGGTAAFALGRLRPNDPRVKQALIQVRDQKKKLSTDPNTREFEERLLAETRMMATWALMQLPR